MKVYISEYFFHSIDFINHIFTDLPSSQTPKKTNKKQIIVQTLEKENERKRKEKENTN